MSRRPTRRGGGWRSTVTVLVVVLAATTGIASFETGSAAPVAQTVNLGNSVTAHATLPPTNVTASLSLNVLGLSCRATITWTPSAAPGVGAYEIRRRIAATGAPSGGPWTVPGTSTSYVDASVPLAVVGTAYEWQVRAVAGGWPSAWVTATVDRPLLCLL